METETTTWSEFPNGGKATVEQILRLEEINKSKGARLWESQSGIHIWKLTNWVRSFEVEKLWQNSAGVSVPPELAISPYIMTSSKTDIFSDRSIFKLCTKKKMVINKESRSKTPNEVKQIKNINKSPQSFLNKSHSKESPSFT